MKDLYVLYSGDPSYKRILVMRVSWWICHCRSSINRIIDTLTEQILRIEPSERAHPKMITWELIGSST